ncbi:hypothetical protein HaLaN_29274, partial [Haematococcus lacustris]
TCAAVAEPIRLLVHCSPYTTRLGRIRHSSLTPRSRPDEEVISRRREQGPAVSGPAGPASGTPRCSPPPAGCKQ